MREQTSLSPQWLQHRIRPLIDRLDKLPHYTPNAAAMESLFHDVQALADDVRWISEEFAWAERLSAE